MRELAYTRLPHRCACNSGNVHGVARFLRIELHQLRGRERSRERAVGHMIPAARANARGIAKTALHFISERDRGDQLSPIRAGTLGDRQSCRNVIARMRWFLGRSEEHTSELQ